MEKIQKNKIASIEIQRVPMVEPLSEVGKAGMATDFNKEYQKAIGKEIELNPKIVVIGQGRSLRDVSINLKKLGTKLEVVSTIDALPKLLWPTLRAIVVVESKNTKFNVRECQKLVKNWNIEEIPIFVIVPNVKDAMSERRIYKAGVQAIFEWPREKSELTHLMSNMMDLKTITSPKETSDGALKIAVRNRLLADNIYYSPKRLAISVYNGIVMFEGVVRSFARLQRLKVKVLRIPGVRGVLARSVKVKTDIEAGIRATNMKRSVVPIQRVRDQAAVKSIKRFINESLKRSSQETIKIGVFNGVAYLNGFVGKRSISKKVEQFAVNTAKVMSVQNKIKIIN